MIEIDGSYLEGGGQIVRTAVSLSLITNQPCQIFNIRKGRKKPGLKTQHLLALEKLTEISHGYIEGNQLGSLEIKFFPQNKEIDPKTIFVNIKTAASITLLLQSLIPPLLFAQSPTKIIFNGGATDTFFSPSFDYFRFVFLELLKEKIGIEIKTKIIKRGFYPEGGAKIELIVFPQKPKSISLIKRKGLKKIIVLSGASLSLKEKKVAERQLQGAKQVLKPLLPLVEEKIEYYSTKCPGSQITILAKFKNTVIGTDNLGQIGKRAEIVGQEAALNLIKQAKTNACVDINMGDQILIYMALSHKPCRISVAKITNHLKTNIWVLEKFLKGRFSVKKNIVSWNPQ